MLLLGPRPWVWQAAESPGALCLGAVHSVTGVGIPRRPCLFATASSSRPPSNPRRPPPRRQSHTVFDQIVIGHTVIGQIVIDHIVIGRISDAAR